MGLPAELVVILGIAVLMALHRCRRGAALRVATPAPALMIAAAPRGAAPAAGPAPAPAALPFAIESDGHVWLPDRHRVHRFSLFGPDASFEDEPRVAEGSLGRREFFERHPQLCGGRAPWMPSTLHAGDLSGARVARGDDDAEPWRLETLGPEGEYVAYGFDTREGAAAALGILESRRVVRRPRDGNGRPIPAAPGDFEEGRLRWERTVALLVEELLDPRRPVR